MNESNEVSKNQDNLPDEFITIMIELMELEMCNEENKINLS